MNYTPGVQVRPVSTALPTALGAIGKQAPRTSQQQAFNTPAYLRNNTSQEQWGEMNRGNQDRYRANLAQGQASMGRGMQQANNQNLFGSLLDATNAANNFYDVSTNAIRGDQQNQLGWLQGMTDLNRRKSQTFMPMLGSLLGGGF